MDYTDKGKSFDKIRKETFKHDLARCGVEFFKFPACKAFSLASEAHYHEAIELLLVDNGSLTVYNDGKWEKVNAGDLVVCRSMGVHSIFTDDRDINDYYVLKVMPNLLYNVSTKYSDEFPLRFSVYNSGFKTIWRQSEIDKTDIAFGLNRLISQLDNDGKSAGSEVSIVVSALLVLESIYESDKTPSDKLVRSKEIIHRAVAFVTSNYAQNITKESVAKKFGMSESHFSREFKRATGKTFKEYLTSIRLDQAERLLLSTSMTVSEIAGKCGYSSFSYFISLYKKVKGQTPYQYRKV